jgi:hypothetical protein
MDMLEQMKIIEDHLEEGLNEIDRLKEMNKNAMNQIYHAYKGDPIDERLGSFLNTFPEREKIKILFLRESEGVYQFNQKRVYIKVEQGDRILVRVGGGYMHIKEFIEKYTQGEVDKIERKDVFQKFANK